MANKFRVQKSVTAVPVVHAAQAIFSVANVPLNGVLWENKVKSSAATDGAATMTLNVIDADGDTVYTKAAIAGNTTTVTNLTADLRVPLNGLYTIQIVFSANQTVTDQTVTVTLLIDRG